MPRRQRRRRRGPAEYAGPRRAKLPFPLNLIFNVKAFYGFFIIVMIAGIAAVGIAPSGRSRGTAPDIEDDVIAEETPAAALTFDAPAHTIDGRIPHVATIKTDKGDIKIDLVTDAPETVNSFAFLAGSGFYNGTVFFYVDPHYWAQAGDPTCKAASETVCSGTGGPGYTLKLEAVSVVAGPTRVGQTFSSRQGLFRDLNPDTAIPPVEEIDTWLRDNGYVVEDVSNEHDQWAVAALTLGGEDIHGSQFRILYQADHRLDGEETVFGTVVEGRDILEGLKTLAPCEVVSSESCDPDFSSALVIEEIIVEPKAV